MPRPLRTAPADSALNRPTLKKPETSVHHHHPLVRIPAARLAPNGRTDCPFAGGPLGSHSRNPLSVQVSQPAAKAKTPVVKEEETRMV